MRIAILFFLLAIVTPCNAEKLFGVCAHVDRSKQSASFVISALKDLGLNSFRGEYSWNNLEREKGVFQISGKLAEMESLIALSRRNGIEPLIVLGYGNRNYDGGDFPLGVEAREGYLRYVDFVARRFKGVVRHYEIWNEWNIGLGLPESLKRKGSAADYCSLLKDAYRVVKGIDPNAIVIGGVVANKEERWIRDALEAGCLENMDGFSVHPYNFSEGEKSHSVHALKYLIGLDQVLSTYHGGASFPIYVTEMGWPNHIGFNGRTQDDSANELHSFLSGIKGLSFVRGVWVYDLVDDGGNVFDKEHNFGLMNQAKEKKKQYNALKKVLSN